MQWVFKSAETACFCFGPYLMQVQGMDQNSLFLNAIDREAIKSQANGHHQKSLPGKDITLKTTQSFLKNTCELYVTY